jgi:hypothetical protein
MPNHNLELLTEAARLLKPLLGELVFVGGCTTALLITDKAAADVRPTYDVDAIAEITSYAAYADFSERLRRTGFTEDTSEGAPICRWRQKKTILDVMPLDEKILGFSNRWYRPAMETAEERELEPDLRIRVVTAAYFCATKLEAFASRGEGDYMASHDLEDLLSVIDGRPELVKEIQSASQDVRSYVASEVGKMLGTEAFVAPIPQEAGTTTALPSDFPSPPSSHGDSQDIGIHDIVTRHVRVAMKRVPEMRKKRIGPHTIRHTTATHLLRAGVDINTIRAWLGHVSIDTTNIYAETDLDMKTKALGMCEVKKSKSRKRWRDNPDLMSFLARL